MRPILPTLAMVLAMCAPLGLAPAAVAQTPAAAELVAHTWTATAIDGEVVSKRPAMTVTFLPSGAVIGSGGCNRFRSTWGAFGTDRLFLAQPAVGRVRCKAPILEQEARYIDRLRDAESFQVRGDRLDVVSAFGGGVTFRAAAQGPGLLSGRWTLAAIDGEPLPARTAASIEVGESGRAIGANGCNDLFATWTTDGADISFGPVLVTEATCEGPAGAVEDALVGGLAGAATWAIEGDTLDLRPAKRGTRLTFHADRPVVLRSLTETGWTLVRFGDVEVDPAAGYTLRFGDDGQASGTGPCNRFFGPYTTDEPTLLAIGPLAITRHACDQAVVADESRYLDALEAVTGWKLPQNQLRLATGSLVLLFDPVPLPEAGG